MWRRVVNKLRFLVTRDHLDRNLDEEFDFHREMLEIANVRAGLDRELAAVAARRQFGNVALAREDARNVWMFAWLETSLRDLRLALRGLRRSPWFSLAAVSTLALGIGANTAVFRVLDAVALRALPVRNAGSLVRLQGLHDGKTANFSYPLFQEMAARQQSLASLFATLDVPGVTVTTAGAAEPIADARVRLATGAYFRGLGVDAGLGRVFDESDDRLTVPPVAVISHAFWSRSLGGRPDVPGHSLRVNDVLVTVVGVTPADFFGEQIGTAPDVWLPMSLAPQMSVGWLLQPGSSFLCPMGPLRPGVARDRAQAALDVLYRQLAEYDVRTKGTKAVALEVQPGARGLRGIRDEFSGPLWMLMGVVGLVVLIACCNLASLLLARGARRSDEIGVRLALGATRSRLARELLTESLALAAAGGLLGVGMAAWGSRELVRLAGAGASWRMPLGTDWRVLGFAAALSVLMTCVFGLTPALKAAFSQPPLQAGLRSRGGARSSRRVAKGFVIAQVATSLLLVSGASLLGRSFLNLTRQDFGYRPAGVLAVRLPFDPTSLKLTRNPSFRESLDRRMNEIPGVLSAAQAGAGPLGTMQRLGGIALPDRPAAAGEEARFVSVSPHYFETMGIPILTGRPITDMDRPDSPRVAVISETAARRIFGLANPVGRVFTNGDRFDPRASIQVVGVAHDLRFFDPRDPFGIVVYQPLRQSPAPLTSIVLRTAGDPGALALTTERALRAAAPGLKIRDVVPLTYVLESSLGQERMMALLSGALGLLAMILAALGLYGVTAYGIAERTREIGVRLAVGASPARVVRQFLGEVVALLSIGLAIGGVATILLGRVMTTFLFGLTPQDPWVLSFAGGLLVTVVMLAGYVAARHAAALDPMRALRQG